MDRVYFKNNSLQYYEANQVDKEIAELKLSIDRANNYTDEQSVEIAELKVKLTKAQQTPSGLVWRPDRTKANRLTKGQDNE